MLERGDCEKPTPQWLHRMKSCRRLEDRESYAAVCFQSLSYPPELGQQGRLVHSQCWRTAQAPLLHSQMPPGDVLLPKPSGAQPGVSTLARGQ